MEARHKAVQSHNTACAKLLANPHISAARAPGPGAATEATSAPKNRGPPDPPTENLA